LEKYKSTPLVTWSSVTCPGQFWPVSQYVWGKAFQITFRNVVGRLGARMGFKVGFSYKNKKNRFVYKRTRWRGLSA
jgi:hypothetical protein